MIQVCCDAPSGILGERVGVGETTEGCGPWAAGGGAKNESKISNNKLIGSISRRRFMTSLLSSRAMEYFR
jgi:hypothetical protein